MVWRKRLERIISAVEGFGERKGRIYGKEKIE